MARPWLKRSAWPYLAKSGRRSYAIGFYDHDKTERSKTFPSVRHARAWMDDYITAERRGRESLRRFLLDFDAKEANAAEAGRTIGEVLELYLALNAHPRNEGGLAPSTYERYEWTIGRHLFGKSRRMLRGGMRPPAGHALRVASVPAERFNEPQAPRAWRELASGVSKPTRDQAWSVLSAALSWAAASQLVPEIQTNGCGLANEPRVNRRRSIRHGGTGLRPGPSPPRAGRRELGALAPSRRGDQSPTAAVYRRAARDPRAAGRDDRQSAVRALRAQPGGLGPALGLLGWRVRLGARCAPLRAVE
ncbi:MAG TPA: hypothetical protein VG053_07365 [Solirubrobacteraceae bacterium]|nr:hypothetical protein [Solirubrobacteraceae bacterium]